jgi:histidine triad (HIT) family protein
MKQYDKKNAFAKILRGELSTNKIYEDEQILCFEDATPATDVHWLIIPKGDYISFDDFTKNATPEEIASFFQSIAKIARIHGLDKKGYKLVTNNGAAVGQSVFHFHVHLLSGNGLTHL